MRQLLLRAGLIIGPIIMVLPIGACGRTSTSDSESRRASTGWAESADIFRGRWNDYAKPAFALGEFKGTKASFSDGVVTYWGGGMISIETDDHPMVGALCVAGYMAAYGADHDEAHIIVGQAIDDGRSSEESGSGFLGYKTYGRHVVNVAVSPSGRVTCSFINRKS